MVRNSKGITLIALVVTIIVLLILAGVSLNLIMGNEGILGKAVKAVEATEIAKFTERKELLDAQIWMDMRKEGESNLYDYIQSKCEENVNKSYEIENGKYWLDEDGTMNYTDIETGGNAKIEKGENGELVMKEIIIAGNKQEATDKEEPPELVQTYEITYHANGGSGEPQTQSKTMGVELTISDVIPTRNGYTFQGWAKSADGEVIYQPNGKYTENEAVTLYAIWKAEKAIATTIITATNYGDKTNYSANGINDWKVFLNDGNYVYLISGDYVPNKGISNSTGLNKTGSYQISLSSRNQYLSALLVTSNWSKYAEGLEGATATGGPTKEQFIQSYNEKYNESYSSSLNSTETISGLHCESPYFINDLNKAYYYALASISSNDELNVWLAFGRGSVTAIQYAADYIGIRPLVKLPSNALAQREGDYWCFSL